MALPPKKLFIPRKGVKQPNMPVSTGDHDTNMRAIEQYINNLTAGSGTVTEITTATPADLTITNATGPVVNIDFTGSSGSGGNVGILEVEAGPDSILLQGSDWFPLGFMFPSINEGRFPIVSGKDVSYGMGWWTGVANGESVNVLPILVAPTFTGATDIQVSVIMSAFIQDGTDTFYGFTSSYVNLTSGQTKQLTLADVGLTAGDTSFGGFLVATAGTGLSGNGFVSNGGGGRLYFGSISGDVLCAAGTVF